MSKIQTKQRYMTNFSMSCRCMAIGLTVVSLLSGCSRQVSDTASSPEGGGTTSSEPIKQYIASVIKDNDDPRATYPMTKPNGRFSNVRKRLEACPLPITNLAWSHYKQCVVDKGYSTPVLDRYPNGLYFVARINAEGMTDEQRNKFNKDDGVCFNTEVIYVNDTYALQLGNPQMINDVNQAAVNCLKRENVAPKGYTKKLFEQDEKNRLQDEHTELNYSDPKVQSCLAALGITTMESDKVWRPAKTSS